MREADGSACGIVGRQKQREKELRGGLERLVMVVPCGTRVRLCLLDMCASPSWWSSRLKQPCQLKTASKAALKLPGPPLFLFLTHSFVPPFLLPVSLHPLPIASCGFRTRVSLVSPQFFSSSLSSFRPKAS